jgi:ABC-type phosphonate transport system ATPase subunit
MWEQTQPMMLDIISGIGLSILGLMAAYATVYINRAAIKVRAETAQIKDQQQRDLIWMATSRLEEVAKITVSKIEQTVAGKLRQAVKDGKVNREELVALGKKAYDEVLKTVEPQVVKVLKDNLGDLKTYLESTIEAEVKRLKK